MPALPVFIYFLEILPYLLSLALTVSVAVFTYRRRVVTGASWFTVILILEAIWTFGYIFELTGSTLAEKAFWDNFQYLGSSLLPIAIVAFALEYTGRNKWPAYYYLGLMGFVALVFVGILHTNPFPGWGKVSPQLIDLKPFSVYTYQFGPGLWAAFILGYVLDLLGFCILGSRIFQKHRVDRIQTAIILAGLFLPTLGTIAAAPGVNWFPNRDISPFTFAIANLIITLGLFRYRMFNLVPMARRSVMDTISDPAIVLDSTELILDANVAAENLAGVNPRGLLGKHLGKVFPALETPSKTAISQAGRSELRFISSDSVRWFEANSTPYKDGLGSYAGRLLILHDITRRKEEEQSLRSSNDTLEEAVRRRTTELETANKKLVAEVDERRRVEREKTVYANELEILFKLAIDLSDIPDDADMDLFIAKQLKELTNSFAVAISAYNPDKKQLEFRQLFTDSAIIQQANALLGRNLDGMAFPVDDAMYQEMTRLRVGYRKSLTEATFGSIPAGVGDIIQKLFNLDNLIGLVVMDNTDLLATIVLILQKGQAAPSEPFLYAITHLTTIAFKRSRAEKMRRESETRFHQMADLLPQVIYECDLEGQVTYANRYALDLFGVGRLAPGFHVTDFVVESQRPKARAAVELILSGRQNDGHEFMARRNNGESFPVLIYSSAIIKDGQPAGLRGVLMDISEIKRTELALRESEERYRRVIETSPDGIAISGLDGKIIAVNQKDAEMWGYQVPEEMVGLNMGNLLAPEDRDRARQDMHKALADHQPGPFSYRFVRKDGSTFYGELNSAFIYNPDGRATSFVAITRDITERKMAEEAIRKLNTELEQRVASRTEALEASNKELEAFSYSVSHDLRAPLRSMVGFSQVLMEDYAGALDAQGLDYLQRIQNSGRTMSELIDDLLNLSRIARVTMSRKEVDLGAIARTITQEQVAGQLAAGQQAAGQQTAGQLAAGQLERSVEFIIPETLLAYADRSLIQIVLENLLGNAWKFSSKVEVSRIELGTFTQDQETVYFVRDNGAGFDMAYVDKLFGAFQRLHSDRDFEGTGIGLSIVQRIIHRHGGRVWAQGETGKGATFFFTLP